MTETSCSSSESTCCCNDQPSSCTHSHSRPRALWPTVILLVLTAIVFGRVVTHDFLLLDDPKLIFKNPAFNPVSWPAVMQNWREPYMAVYMPLTFMLWGAVAAIARHATPDAHGVTLNPAYFHALNLLLHLIAVSGAYVLLRRMLPNVSRVAATLGAAVFAVHPLQVEAVAWAGDGMYAVLSGALSLWALCAYSSFARATDARRRWICGCSATLLYVLAMLSKPTAISVPLIAAAIDLLLLQRPWRRVAPLPAAWAVAGLAFVLITSRLHDSGYLDSPIAWRPLVALDALGFYLGKLIAPLWLTPDYGRRPRWVIEHLGQAVASAIVAAGLIVTAILLWRRGRRTDATPTAVPLAAAIAIFVLGLAPSLGVKQFLFQWYSTVADRYAYIALLGASVALATLVHARPRLLGPAAALVVALAIGAAVQVGRWRDTRSLFTYTAAVRPNALLANTILADDAAERGADTEAIAHFRAAIDSRPDDPIVTFKYGRFLLQRGKYEQAARYLAQSMLRMPDNPNAHLNLGVALANLNQISGAEAEFLRAVALAQQQGRPDAEAWQNLALVYANTGRQTQAIDAYEHALAIDPRLKFARDQLDRLRGTSAKTDPGEP